MSVKKKYSKDPKVELLSICDFFENNGYLEDLHPDIIWHDDTIPQCGKYYKFTSNLLISLFYSYKLINYGTDVKENLAYIQVAYRDGKTEFELIDAKLTEAKRKLSNDVENNKVTDLIESLTYGRTILPEYHEPEAPAEKSFDSYLIDTGYITSNPKLQSKYLVFDVETNGTRKANDDLLSLSIYDPTTGMCYNRFLPLDLQPLVLTTYINGITADMLCGVSHLCQKEMDWLIDYFHMKDRIMLSYSGGKGTFDPVFVSNYCKRHNISGFDDLIFENIKNKLPTVPFGAEGQLTKDNLCKWFGIDGVTSVHSSYNDCVLQWKLFEKLEEGCFFFINEQFYKYSPEYIIPVSYLLKYDGLRKSAGIKLPFVEGKATEIFKLEFPKKLTRKIRKFPTNITGITLEHGINALLGAKKQNNAAFLTKNKSHLEYVASLNSKMNTIPVIAESDGSVSAVREEDIGYISSVNDVTKMIVEHVRPIADFLKENIFVNNTILSQEISISEDGKVLALCDLSDENNVVEIKTFDVLMDDGQTLKDNIALQLYYQAKGRNTYVLSVKFDTHQTKAYDTIVDDINLYLYRIELIEHDISGINDFRQLLEFAKKHNLL